MKNYILIDFFLGQFNELHDVWLLYMTQYTNSRVLIRYISFPYRNSIARVVIVEGVATEQLYRIVKNK